MDLVNRFILILGWISLLVIECGTEKGLKK